MRSIDITGSKFGRLIAVRMAAKGSLNPFRHQKWLCRCECDGKEAVVAKCNLLSGHTTSCGCLQQEVRVEANTVHGHASRNRKTSEYHSWVDMRKRCSNPNNKQYKDYGGRGITVCERWSDFESFLADMGLKPSPKHEIDRYPDNNGNYEPDNCRWATLVEQANNKSTNRFLTIGGRTQTLAQWEREANIPRPIFRKAVDARWSPELLAKLLDIYRERARKAA